MGDYPFPWNIRIGWIHIKVRWKIRARRLIAVVLLCRYQPRCAATPPDLIGNAHPAAGPCILPRWYPNRKWHADGTGYIWNETQWAWRGDPIDLSEEYANIDWDDPKVMVSSFVETAP